MNTTRAMLIIGVLMLVLAVIVAQSLRPDDTQNVTGPVHSGIVIDETAKDTSAESALQGNSLMPLNTGVLKMDSTTPATGLAPVSPADITPSVETVPPIEETTSPSEVLPAQAPAEELPEKSLPQVDGSAGETPPMPQDESPPTTEVPQGGTSPQPETSRPSQAEKLVATSGAPSTLARGQKAINHTRLEITRNSLTFRLSAGSAISGKAFVLKQPDRIVVDLDGPWAVEMPKTPSNSFIRDARAGNQEVATRIVFDMRRMPRTYKLVQIDATTLELQLHGT